MRLEIHRHRLVIVSEDKRAGGYDERDTAFIEEVLGLRKNGDSIKLVRRNAHGLSCLGVLETELSACGHIEYCLMDKDEETEHF